MGSNPCGDTGWRDYKVTDGEINHFDYTVKLHISGTLDLYFSEAPREANEMCWCLKLIWQWEERGIRVWQKMMTLKSREGKIVWKKQSISSQWYDHLRWVQTERKVFGYDLGMEPGVAEENIMDGLINHYPMVETLVWQTVEKALIALRMYQTRIVWKGSKLL